jgi:hypothetical protein
MPSDVHPAEWLEWAWVVGQSPEVRGESDGEEDQGQGGDEHGRPRAGGTSGWGIGFVSQGRLPDLRGGGLVLRIGMIHGRGGGFVRLGRVVSDQWSVVHEDGSVAFGRSRGARRGRVVSSQWSVVREDGSVAFGRSRGGRSALNQSRGGRFVRRVLFDRGAFGRADCGLGRPGPNTSTRVAHSWGHFGGRLGVGGLLGAGLLTPPVHPTVGLRHQLQHPGRGRALSVRTRRVLKDRRPFGRACDGDPSGAR